MRQGLALRRCKKTEGNLPQFLLLLSDDCPTLRHWLESGKYMSHDIFSELMGLMAVHMLNKILVDIRTVSLYSLVVHEASDVAHKEQM